MPYLDGELNDAEKPALEAHLAQCLACAREVESHRHVARALFAERHRAIPADGVIRSRLSDAEFVRQVRQRSPRRGLTVSPRVLVRLAALVTFAAGVFGMVFWSPRAPTSPPDELLGALEVLEALDAAGLEPTSELAQTLEELTDDSELLDAHDSLWGPLSEENL